MIPQGKILILLKFFYLKALRKITINSIIKW
jgi:hypothetical protein